METINTYCIIWHTQRGWTTWKKSISIITNMPWYLWKFVRNGKMETLVHIENVPMYIALSFQHFMAKSKMAMVPLFPCYMVLPPLFAYEIRAHWKEIYWCFAMHCQSLEILAVSSKYILSLTKFLSHNLETNTINITIHGINRKNILQLHKPTANLTLFQKQVYYMSI